MVSCRLSLALVLALIPFCKGAKSSFLQNKERLHHNYTVGSELRRSTGDWDETEVRLCTIAAKTDSDNVIKVFADEAENTRYVSFARVGYATDDGFIESMQKCKGTFPEACKKKDSSGCAACPCDLDLANQPFGNYQNRMLKLLVPRCQASGKEPFRVLLVGLGGGALVQYILGRCPKGTIVEAVEYDPRMIEVATRFFGLHPSPDAFKVDQGDGGAGVASRAKEKRTYNMVLVDAFAGGSHVPESCRNEAFIDNARRILVKGGSLLHNMAGPTYSNLAGTGDHIVALPLYKKSFGSGSVKLLELTGNMEFPSYIIVANVPP